MDAAALLKSQGWRGKGNSLHPTANALGLATPLLFSRNTTGAGVGASGKHHTGDAWWLRAFDEKLKGLDTTKSGKGQVRQTVVAVKKAAVVVGVGERQGRYSGRNGLYARFTRGEGLRGTMEDAPRQRQQQRKQGDQDDDDGMPEGVAVDDAGLSRDCSGKDGREIEARRKAGKNKGLKTRSTVKARQGETNEERRARKEAQRQKRAENASE